jgi:hypothetical protein
MFLGYPMNPAGFEPVTPGIKGPILFGTNLCVFLGGKLGKKWARQDSNL